MACGGERRAVTEILETPDRPTGRSSQSSPVIGTWQVMLLVGVESDLQEWTTRWRFDTDGKCRFERTTFSYVEGVRRTTSRTCTYLDRGTLLQVRYDDTGRSEDLPYQIPAFSTRRLILEGVEYERVA